MNKVITEKQRAKALARSRAQAKALLELKANHLEEYQELYAKWCVEFGNIPLRYEEKALKLLKGLNK